MGNLEGGPGFSLVKNPNHQSSIQFAARLKKIIQHIPMPYAEDSKRENWHSFHSGYVVKYLGHEVGRVRYLNVPLAWPSISTSSKA